MHKFPEYIWDKKTGRLIIYSTGKEFINPSEYCDGALTFNTPEDAQQFLDENSIKGTLGVKLIR